MAASIEKKIASFALLSRVFVLIFQVFCNNLIPDHNADVFNPPPEEREMHILDPVVHFLLGGLRRWDGVYFLHIAEFGYTYQNCLAFFPLYPWLVKILASYCLPLQYIMNYSSLLLVMSATVNLFLFVQTAVTLYQLGQQVLGDHIIAYRAALLFCINPASIFFSAPYSETIFAYLTFWGMLKFETQSKSISSFLFGVSSFARSNGIVSAGFQLHSHFLYMINQGRLLTKAGVRNFKFACNIIFSIFLQTFVTAVWTLIVMSVFLFYQGFAYLLFCTPAANLDMPSHIKEYGIERGYTLIGDMIPAWCNDSIPLAYSHIQKHHWDVGFLKYYQLKQIPNFLLVVPVTMISVSACVCYFQLNKRICLSLGTCDEEYEKIKKSDDQPVREDIFQTKSLLPYMAHLLFLTLFGWLFMHIQVVTRFLFSSAPPLYWFAARVITMETMEPVTPNHTLKSEEVENISEYVETETNVNHPYRNWMFDLILSWKLQKLKTRLILIYFIGYLMVGTFAFSNFLPWT